MGHLHLLILALVPFCFEHISGSQVPYDSLCAPGDQLVQVQVFTNAQGNLEPQLNCAPFEGAGCTVECVDVSGTSHCFNVLDLSHAYSIGTRSVYINNARMLSNGTFVKTCCVSRSYTVANCPTGLGVSQF